MVDSKLGNDVSIGARTALDSVTLVSGRIGLGTTTVVWGASDTDNEEEEDDEADDVDDKSAANAGPVNELEEEEGD